jgi:hypothetical protein
MGLSHFETYQHWKIEDHHEDIDTHRIRLIIEQFLDIWREARIWYHEMK